MADINKIAEELGTLTILEAADLVKLLEEKWGVSAAAPVAAAGAADDSLRVDLGGRRIIKKKFF